MKLETEFELGEEVFDDLTGKRAKIIGIGFELGRKGLSALSDNVGSFGYWVDNDWAGGGRHPWEVSKL